MNVDGTTSSVTYVTGQIQMVAEGARGARAMARNVEEVCSEASASVRELQRNLVRIVRTSSGTVNRRAHQRYEVNSFGTMDKRIAPIEIVDLSESGAKLIADIDATVRAIQLNIPGMSKPLRSLVVFHKGGVIHVKFEISGSEQEQLRSLLARASESGARKLSEAAA